MFDTRKVANQIKTARKNKNMTQMDLADAMGVSYQAVSNWERGNSMPDISKIPEICQVLGLSFEELVGEKSQITRTVKRMIDGEDAGVTLEEVADIAPILEPKQVEDAVKETADSGIEVNFSTILELAPFISEEAIDTLCEKTVGEDPWMLMELAPFASEETLDRLVKNYQGSLGEALPGLAPFLSEETLDHCVEGYLRGKDCDLDALMGMAPFLSQETVDKIVAHLLKHGQGDHVADFAPFVSDGIINNLFGEKFSFFGFGKGKRKEGKTSRPIRNGGMKLHPEMPEESKEPEEPDKPDWEDMDKEELTAYLDHMDEDAMRELILKMAGK